MGKYHCTADLLFDWFGFDQSSKPVCSFNISKSAESKQNKQEGILPFKLVLSAYTKSPLTIPTLRPPTIPKVPTHQQSISTLTISSLHSHWRAKKWSQMRAPTSVNHLSLHFRTEKNEDNVISPVSMGRSVQSVRLN